MFFKIFTNLQYSKFLWLFIICNNVTLFSIEINLNVQKA